MKKIILGTIAVATTAVVGGVVVATINENQIGVPMSEEPQTIIEEQVETIEIEYTPIKEEADIVVERIIEEKVEPKAEVIEPKPEPVVETNEKDECQEFLNYLVNVYGSTNVLDVIRKGHKAVSDILDRNNITEWEDFETRYLNHDIELSAIPQHVYNLAKGYAIRKAEFCKE